MSATNSPLALGVNVDERGATIVAMQQQGDITTLLYNRFHPRGETMGTVPLPVPFVDGWTKEPPTEQGEYWHWNGDTCAAPFALSVMWSGGAKKCFVSMKDTHTGHAEWCDKYGGYWLRIRQPSIAGALALEQLDNIGAKA